MTLCGLYFQLIRFPREGHLGHLTLNIPWANLTSKPAEIVIEDLYLLAIPAAESKVDLAEDEAQAQAAKQEKLKNAEILQASGREFNPNGEDNKNQGVLESLIGKIVNNVQITVRNIHIRYEDSVSVPSVSFPPHTLHRQFFLSQA
jgi:vacuolar protein sorting-associated protein 13A/C